MEVDAQPLSPTKVAAAAAAVGGKEEHDHLKHMSRGLRWALIVLNCVLMAVGYAGGPLLLRLYYVRGGARKWLPSWLQTAGFPILLIPLLITYIYRRRRHGPAAAQLVLLTPRILLASALLGIFIGFADIFYAHGLAELPLSTSALLVSSQLAFTAVFALLILRQRFTPYSVNAVALLTAGAAVLGLHSGGDRPEGESRGQYWVGFVMTLGGAALTGLLLPLVGLVYERATQKLTYTLVMEMQFVMSFSATALCTVGLLVNNDFRAIPKEAHHFESGKERYYVVLVWSAIFWQFFFLGTIGVVFCVNSLLGGILGAVFIPVSEVLAVIFFDEKFSSQKGLALVLSLWGLASYSYGEYRESKEKDAVPATPSSETPTGTLVLHEVGNMGRN